nr:uncharacterized protein LOC103426280 isoform X1 [Malus domestica]
MANDAVFRSSLVWLAVVIVVVGICTQSLKKMMLTYVVGVLGIAGLLLPDWGYFDRDFSRWTSPVSFEERASEIAQRSGLITSVEPKNNQEATRGFLGEEDKIILETHRVSYMRAAENHPSTESRVPKIGNKFKFILFIFTPYPLQGNHSITFKTFHIN